MKRIMIALTLAAIPVSAFAQAAQPPAKKPDGCECCEKMMQMMMQMRHSGEGHDPKAMKPPTAPAPKSDGSDRNQEHQH